MVTAEEIERRRMKKIVLFIVNLLFYQLSLTSYSFSAVYELGNREWMMHPASARVAGMGRGIVAILDNANTVFWNPGGLAFTNGLNVSYSYFPFSSVFYPVTDSKLHYFSICKIFKKAFVGGFNFSRYNEYSYFIKNDMSRDFDFGISFALKINNLGLGFNTKYVSSRTAESKYYLTGKYEDREETVYPEGKTFAWDVGMMYKKEYIVKKIYNLDINFGLSILNTSKPIKYNYLEYQFKEALPSIIRTGCSATFKTLKKEGKLTPFTVTTCTEYSDVINAEKYWDYKSVGFGFEILMHEILNLRTGYYYQKGSKYKTDPKLYDGFTYGIGINIPLLYYYETFPITIKYDYAQFPLYSKSKSGENRHFKIHSLSINYMY